MKLTQTAQRTLIALFFTLVAIACGLAWRAPAQPTCSAVSPRSVTFTSSTGLFFAAMIPLNDG